MKHLIVEIFIALLTNIGCDNNNIVNLMNNSTNN